MASNDKGLEEIPESMLLCFRVQAHTCDLGLAMGPCSSLYQVYIG